MEELIGKIQYLNLKVLWLNGNPIANNEQILEYVATKTRIEIFNSKCTKNCTEWGLKYANFRNLKAASGI